MVVLSKSLKCYVANSEMYVVWKFFVFFDVMSLVDVALAAFPEATAIDSPPVLVRADDGAPEVWLVDGKQRRHVTGSASARAWHFDLGTVVVKPAAWVKGLTLGPPLRFRPMLAKGDGPAIWLLDAVPGEVGPGPSTGSDGGAPAVPGDTTNNGGDQTAAGCACATRDTRTSGTDALLFALFSLSVLGLRRSRRR